jgi:hypothetical protein
MFGLVLTLDPQKQYVMLEKCFTVEDASVEIKFWMSFKNCLYIVGWFGSYRLLIYQYRKGLSETWYSHQMFWVLNFFSQVSLLIYCLTNGVTKYYGIWLSIPGAFVVSINCVLVVFLFNTTKRTVDRPRPADIHYAEDGSLIE